MKGTGRKFAIIPWSEAFAQDRMFQYDNPRINRDYLLEPYYEMQQFFAGNGDELHTIDMYDRIEGIDYFLFFVLDWSIVYKLVSLGKADRMVYCTAEPPIVEPRNTPKGYKKLKQFFPYILTFNPEWVDGKSIFIRNDPYFFVDDRDKAYPFCKKKLITFISGNKTSDHPDELYSERRRAIEFFEETAPQDFDFYGTGWDKERHRCYRGVASNKREIYYKYKYAICYENMRNIRGYVSEKILDCLVAGIVPIYAGATDITNFVPSDCFIHLDDFQDYDSLLEYITGLEEKDYQMFLDAADSFLKSGKTDLFSGTRYATCIYDAIKENKRFKPTLYARLVMIKDIGRKD